MSIDSILSFAVGALAATGLELATHQELPPHAHASDAIADTASESSVITVVAKNYAVKQDSFVSTMSPSTLHYRATFFHLHTHELWPVAEVPDALEEAHFLRCRATGSEHEIASVLVPMALDMADHFHVHRIEVVSGYRSPKLNELLRKKEHQVASESQHTEGHALDFKLPGVAAVALAKEVSKHHVGGIGTYRENNFVHIDIGRVRRWNGR